MDNTSSHIDSHIEGSDCYQDAEPSREVDLPASLDITDGALLPLTAALLECVTPADVSVVIVERGMAALGAIAGIVGLVTADGNDVELVRVRGLDPSVDAQWHRFPIQGDYPLSTVIRERAPLFISTGAEYYARFPHLYPTRTRDTKSTADLPLLDGDRVIGSLHFSFPNDWEFTASDRTFAVELSRLCALAMGRALARSQAERSRRRLEFLVRATEELSSSFNYAQTLNKLAHLMVPEFCDYAMVCIVEPGGGIDRVVVAHEKPERESLVREMYERYPVDPERPSHTLTAIKTGQTILLNGITDDMIRMGAVDEDHLRYLRELQLVSALTVPVSARGITFGAISYAMSAESGRSFDTETVTFLEELTRRAGVFVDNVRLYADAQREIAERKAVEEERSGAVAQREAALVENARLTRAAADLSEQQRDFFKKVLLSVTEGRLILCDSKSELPKPLVPCGDPIPLRGPNDIFLFRRAVEDAAVGLNLTNDRCDDLLTAASEAAMNALVHAGGGHGRICAGRDEDRLQVWIVDNGKGIEFATLPEAVLRKGYSSAGTLGHGFKMIHSFADRVYILTGPQGTTVVIEQARKTPETYWD